MNESMSGPNALDHEEAEAYVRRVLRRIPRPLPERARIAEELRAHLREQIDAGQTPEEAVHRLGPAEDVARNYLLEVKLQDATIARRTGAFLLDLAVGAVALAPLWVLLFLWIASAGAEVAGALDEASPLIYLLALPAAAFVALPVLSIFYFPVLEALMGQTLGKRWLHIHVVRETGEAPGWTAAILRRLPFFLEIFWIDALFALFTRRRQRAFDLVARTFVVRT